MRWSERQRAMLREMGIPPFWPVPADVATVVDVAATAATAGTQAEPLALTSSGDQAGMQRVASMVHDAFDRTGGGVRRSSGATALPSAASPAAPPAASSSRLTPRLSAERPPARPGDAPLGTRPSGIEGMTWPALREAVASCQACSLCQSRTQPVFGVGHEQAQWMIVGEAPGEQEDKQGEPFVGRAGQLLDRMLAALDLTRFHADATRQVFIANVLKCRPPANRNPQPQEVAQCEPYLLRQIALVQPKVIVAMGRFAVQSLLKSTEPIGKLRGRIHEVAGVPVVVTYHPAYLLRSPADKALAWDDLCLAREVMRQAPA